jgi:predicted nucleotidyltransferase
MGKGHLGAPTIEAEVFAAPLPCRHGVSRPDRPSRKALAEAAGVDSKVILFGSHTRGEERPDSDVDFLVIEPLVKDRLKEWGRLRQALGDIHLPMDIVVLDEALAERRAKVPGTMVYHALRDGHVFVHP